MSEKSWQHRNCHADFDGVSAEGIWGLIVFFGFMLGPIALYLTAWVKHWPVGPWFYIIVWVPFVAWKIYARRRDRKQAAHRAAAKT